MVRQGKDENGKHALIKQDIDVTGFFRLDFVVDGFEWHISESHADQGIIVDTSEVSRMSVVPTSSNWLEIFPAER